MVSDLSATLDYATRFISIYVGIPMLIIGMLGSFLNVLVFVSLKTFRRNSCGFYLTVMSVVNLALLATGLLSRITISGFALDWTQTSAFYCKARVYINQLSILTSLTCICLATIDQFLSTHPTFHWHRKNTVVISRLLIVTFVLIWLLHGIPYLFFYNLIVSPKTGKSACSITSPIFQQYTVYGFLLILSGFAPLLTTLVFGLLAYRNIKQAAHRTVPLVRRATDHQLTNMVLIHIVFDLFTLVPYIVVSIIALDPTLNNDLNVAACIQFLRVVSIYFYYFYFVVRTNPTSPIEKVVL